MYITRDKRLASAIHYLGFDALKEMLTEKQREVFEMYYVQGMTMRAIGKELNVAHLTVYERISAIKKKALSVKK